MTPDRFILVWLGPCLLIVVIYGVGSLFLPRIGRSLPAPWPFALGCLLGWHLAVLLVLALGFCQLWTPAGLVFGFWLPLLGLTVVSSRQGRFSLLANAMRNFPCIRCLTYHRMSLPFLCFSFALLLGGIAMAPPTKHDDLHYHLLIPHRGLLDEGWQPYSTPYLQTAPHIAHQVLLIPLLAIIEDAAASAFNLLWGFVFLLVVFERCRQCSLTRAWVGIAILLLGFGNVVWWVSASPTTISTLWSALLFLWLYDRDRLCSFSLTERSPAHLDEGVHDNRLRPETVSLPWWYTAGAALLATALVLSKISFLLPAGLSLTLVLCWGRRPVQTLRSLVVILVVLLVTAGPWCLGSYLACGHGLGFADPGLAGGGDFDPERLRDEVVRSRRMNQFGEPSSFSPVLALGSWYRDVLLVRDVHPLLPLVAGFGIIALGRLGRWDLLATLLLSAWILAWFVPHSSRFHLFSLLGLFLAGLLATPTNYFAAPLRRWLPLLILVTAIPTLGVAAYYSSMFLPVALGHVSRSRFLKSRTALYDVYQWCNRRTPTGCRFCVDLGVQPRLFYLDRIALSPERLTRAEKIEHDDLLAYMERLDLAFLLTANPNVPRKGMVLVGEFPDVILESYRTPGREPVVGSVWLFRRANAKVHRNPASNSTEQLREFGE